LLRAERHVRQDCDYQEVDIGDSLKLVEQGQWSPGEHCVSGHPYSVRVLLIQLQHLILVLRTAELNELLPRLAFHLTSFSLG